MKKRNSKEEVSLDKRQELYQRKLPVLKGNGKEDIDDYLQELKAIATMVDDLELQSSSDLEREDVKIDFIDIEKMIHGNKAVQIEFTWIHPQSGEVMVRFSGKRVNNSDGMIVLEGYYRMITDVIGACKGETEDEINSK